MSLGALSSTSSPCGRAYPLPAFFVWFVLPAFRIPSPDFVSYLTGHPFSSLPLLDLILDF